MSLLALHAFKDNYIWILVNEREHTFSCVDPGDETPVLNYAKTNGLTLKNILITHHHADHAGGIAGLLKQFPKASVYGPADPRLPLINMSVRDEDIVHIDNLAFRVLSTPGHTSSHICYQEPTKGWLFCGDTLFSAGCGRVFDGTIEQLHHSIQLLKNLPQDTEVYCGHEYTLQNLRFAASMEPENLTIASYISHLQNKKDPCTLPSTIALEQQINPFMRTHIPSIQRKASAEEVISDDALSIFSWLRARKNAFTCT